MNLQLLVLIGSLSIFLPTSKSVRISGQWSNTQLATVLAKFGFQKIDSLNIEHTRGFIYGNITDVSLPTPLDRSVLYKNQTSDDNRLLLVLVTESKFKQFYNLLRILDFRQPLGCSKLLTDLSSVAFESHCFWNGTEDYFRSVPCPTGSLCADEDVPANVIPGYQFTFRIQEKVLPGFWYVSLLSCCLDERCTWRRQPRAVSIDYDLWLVNGSPFAKYTNPFEHQFSFDEQDTPEIYLCALFLYFCLLALQYRAVKLLQGQHAYEKVPTRYIIILQLTSLLLICVHVLVYCSNGRGLVIIRWIGDILSVLSINALTLLVLLLARGWSLVNYEIQNKNQFLIISGILTTLHLIFFIWNSQAVDQLEEIDIYETWPGWGILTIRVFYMCWFIISVRHTVQRCIRRHEEHKAEFLTHFGAGYLVWVVYMPVLAVFASLIGLMWRFKLLLGMVNVMVGRCELNQSFAGITYTADLIADALLVHLLWPRSTNRRFFLQDSVLENNPGASAAMLSLQNQLESEEELDLDEFERELITDELIPMDPILNRSNKPVASVHKPALITPSDGT